MVRSPSTEGGLRDKMYDKGLQPKETNAKPFQTGCGQLPLLFCLNSNRFHDRPHGSGPLAEPSIHVFTNIRFRTLQYSA